MIGVLWAYEGWQYVTFSAGETRDPQRVFPRAIAVATFALIVLYLLANVGYVAAIGPAAAAQSEPCRRRRHARRFSVRSPGKLLSVLALVSIFSATNGLMLTAPRLYFAMARDGLFFARLANVSERFGTPASAIVLLAVLVGAARAHRHVRAAAHLRRVRRLDLLRTRRARGVRVATPTRRMRCVRSGRPAIPSLPCSSRLAAALLVVQHALQQTAPGGDRARRGAARNSGRSSSGVRVVAKWNRRSRRDS